ncbi:alpha/beta hydrolase [Pseudomonas oryzihabitans]|uniref:alpha/beta hydrolase n=1 Tax=Pseudomonas oryzihabitans TaxID=47885 RepID=UPI002895DE9F|nr:alpha/beta hydrolase [Pseudomonas oryzihabitans]MDT3720834.1 alpha/beta hydrolase [Pseudomonas oryzihabitans]
MPDAFARLDPQVASLLTQLAAQPRPPIESLTPQQARAAYVQMNRALGLPAAPVARVQELAAPGPLGPIPLRLYRPQAVDETPTPVVVYLHGGGWVIGDLDSHDSLCRQIALGSGCAVLAVHYALAPEHPAPAGPADVLAALHWLAEAGRAFNLDLERVAVAGDSAGGGLAAMAALHLREGPLALKAQVLIYPGVDNTPTAWDHPSRIENAQVPPLTRPLMDYFSGLYLKDADTLDPRVSPLYAPSHADLPPALIFGAACDALRDDARLYAQALIKAGNTVEYHELPGMIHGFIEMLGVLPSVRWTLARMNGFLREHLGRDA